MGIHNQEISENIELIESSFILIFKKEIRDEIQLLKDKITQLELRLEDPFG